MLRGLRLRSAPKRAAVAITLALIVACAPEKLIGTDLGTQAAPEFVLNDGATGARVSLSGLRGNVVVLAFLYTRCPDVCPLTAEQFRAAQQQLGSDGDRVRFVAVSVDPDLDTPASVRDFSASHRLERNWHYLIGPRTVLAPVWAAYGVRAEPDPSGLGVGHTDAIYLIDRRGNARVLLHTDAGSDAIAKDIRILLKEAG
jgi:protein SCO1/2